MECKFCSGEMKLVWSGGDNYSEPREEDWVCKNCGAKFNITVGLGGCWTNNKGEEFADE